jgi:hypothetical protein
MPDRLRASPESTVRAMTIASQQPLRLAIANAESNRAAPQRAVLGGYVPIDHPGHPSKWTTAERRARLVEADEAVRITKVELRLAKEAVLNHRPWANDQ